MDFVTEDKKREINSYNNMSVLLKSYGYEVTGVDISDAMIERAKCNFSNINFKVIDKECKISKQIDDKFDLILLSLILTDLSSLQKIEDCLRELALLLEDNGKIVIITPSEDLYTKNWFSTENNFVENKNLSSGDLACLSSKIDKNIVIRDHYWRDSDYKKAFKAANLQLMHVHTPFGLRSDPYAWLDEYNYSPFYIYTLGK